MGRYDLRTFAAKHFAQIDNRKLREHAGEERLVELFFDDANEGVFVEVGANEPKTFSQTWHLEQRGWRGLLVEPIPELCERLRKERPHSTIIQAACAGPDQRGTAEFHIARHSGQSTLMRDQVNVNVEFARMETVNVTTLNDVLDEAALPSLDFVSIDVEGAQLDVLRGFDLQSHRPRLLLMEDHLHDLETHRHLTGKGYQLVKRTGLNNWYVPAGTDFGLTCMTERLKLFRKVVLGTPVRKLRFGMSKG